MDARVVVVSRGKGVICHVRIWCVTGASCNWAQRYESLKACVAALDRVCPLTPHQTSLILSLNSRRDTEVLDVEMMAEPCLLIAAGFTEHTREDISYGGIKFETKDDPIITSLTSEVVE